MFMVTVGFLGFALIVCFVRGPREKGWIGWSGGWNPRKDGLEIKPHTGSPGLSAEEELADVSASQPLQSQARQTVK